MKKVSKVGLTQAVEDIVSALSSRGHRKFRIRCSNITQWRTETQRWLQAQDDDVILLQETHLRRGALQDAVAAMHKVGFEMIGGEAFSTARHGTKGGVAVLTKTHIQSRVMQHFTVEGCGFCAVEIRVRGVSLLLLSLYLQNSTPLHCHPNAEIVARLVAVIKHHSGQCLGQWLIAGDFNLSPQEVADTALVNELGGQLHTVGFPTTHGGSELDFAITSSAIAGLISVALDWSAPHRPHASLCIEFLIPGKQDKALRLLDFPVNEAVAEPCLAASKPGPIPIKIMNLDFSEHPVSQKLSSITRWCQDAMYPAEQVPRQLSVFHQGGQNTGRFRTFSCQAGLWLRVDAWLNAVAKTGVKVGHATCQQVALQLEFGDSEPDMASTLREELVGCLTSGETLSRNREEVFCGFAKQAQQEHLAEDSQNYQTWLEGAMVKGMRPLYKAIRSQEMVLVRPFRDKEAALRPYLRYFQWSQIWGSQEEPTEAILPDLQQRAIEEAKGLEPISPAMLRAKFQCLPEKAPGVSGWRNRMLKQLPHGALLPLAQLLTEM